MNKADEIRLGAKVNETVLGFVKTSTDPTVLHEIFVEFGHEAQFAHAIINNKHVSKETLQLAATHDKDMVRVTVAAKINDLTVFEDEQTVIVAAKVAEVATPKKCDVDILLNTLWERFSFKELNSAVMSNENNRLVLVNIAHNEHIPNTLLNKALTTKFGLGIENELLVAVAGRENTSSQLMEQIWNTKNTIDDEYLYFRLMIAFAGRKNLPSHVEETLFKFDDTEVRVKLAENTTIPYRMLRKLLNDEEQNVRTAALKSIITYDVFEHKDWPLDWLNSQYDTKMVDILNATEDDER